MKNKQKLKHNTLPPIDINRSRQETERDKIREMVGRNWLLWDLDRDGHLTREEFEHVTLFDSDRAAIFDSLQANKLVSFE